MPVSIQPLGPCGPTTTASTMPPATSKHGQLHAPQSTLEYLNNAPCFCPDDAAVSRARVLPPFAARKLPPRPYRVDAGKLRVVNSTPLTRLIFSLTFLISSSG